MPRRSSCCGRCRTIYANVPGTWEELFQRQIADVLGVDQATVHRDAHAPNPKEAVLDADATASIDDEYPEARSMARASRTPASLAARSSRCGQGASLEARSVAVGAKTSDIPRQDSILAPACLVPHCGRLAGRRVPSPVVIGTLEDGVPHPRSYPDPATTVEPRRRVCPARQTAM